jgi:YD repeat-containing protein
VVLVVHPAVVNAEGVLEEARETAVYNHLGQLVSATDAEGAVTRFRYHPENDPDGDGQPNPVPDINPNTGGYLAERISDADAGGPFPPARLTVSYFYDPLGRLIRVTDGRGNSTDLLFNQVGELVQYRAPSPFNYRRQFRHDANGNLTGVDVENFTANLDGFPLPVTANRFISASWTYDILDRVVAETREVSEGEAGPARSAETRYRYDGSGNLASIVHPEGDEERFTHDDRDLLLERARGGGTGLDPGGEAVERYDYDENGNLLRVTGPVDLDGDGKREVSEYRYDGFDRLIASIDPAGGTWVVARDPEGRPVSEWFLGGPGGPTPRGGAGNVLLHHLVRSYDERGCEYRTVASRFGPGIAPGSAPAEEKRTFDASGRMVRRVDATGGIWTVERDGLGRPARTTDPMGNLVERRWDASGNLMLETRTDLSDSVINEGLGSIDLDYDPSGRLMDVESTAYLYDALNRLNVSIDGAGRTLRFRYDSRGNLVHRSDAVGTVINANTDTELAILSPLLPQRQSDQANSPGNQVHFEYDGLDRLIRAVHDLRREGSGQTGIDHGNPFNDDGTIDERFEWDGDGRLVAWIDDRGNRNVAVYDRLGRLRVRRDADQKEERYEYDLAGNLIRMTDRMGTVIRQTVDVLSRPVRRELDPGSGEGSFSAEGTRLQLFEYDGLGRPTLAFDGNQPDDPSDDSLVLRSYDSLGGLAFECQGPFVVTAERDVAGRVTAVIYPNGRRISLPRDALGNARELRDGARPFASFSYLGAGRVLGRKLGNGLEQSYLAADGEGVQRLSGLARSGEVLREDYLKASSERALGYEYAYDRAGRRLYERQLLRQGRGPSLRYDSIGRVREVQPDLQDPRVPFPNPTVFTRLYPDGAHNPRLVIVDFVEKRMEVDVLDRLTVVDGKTLAHDLGGNLAATGGLEFRYDGLGRLTRVLRGGATAVKYAHDAVGAWDLSAFRLQGRLSRREVLLPANGEAAGAVRTVFLLDRPIEERAASGGLLRQFLWGPDGRAAAAIDVAGGSEALYYLSDGAGSVAGIADSRGTLLEEVRYDFFGAPAFRVGGTPASASSLGNALLHGARRWEPTARLYQFGGRHYSPDLGRFLNRGGPLALREPLALNRYALLDAVNGFGQPRPEIESDLPRPPGPPQPPAGFRGVSAPGVEEFLPAGLLGR